MIEHTWRDGVEGKVCGICGQWHPLADFPANHRSSDHYASNCKPCKAQMAGTPKAQERRLERRRQAYAANAEAHRAYMRARRAAYVERSANLDDATRRRFWSKVDRRSDDECWEWQAHVQVNGYGSFSHKSHSMYAHRVSWMIAYGDIPEGMCVLHRCDNRCCVNPHHLFLGTYGDNNADMHEKGRANHPAAERHPRTHLTWDDVRTIRHRYLTDDNLLQADLAQEYGVANCTIKSIVCNQTWKDDAYDAPPKRFKTRGALNHVNRNRCPIA